MAVYPASRTARDQFVLDRRPERVIRDPWQFQGLVVEDERTADGSPARVATVFITGRECPWRCVMCDLWQFTIAGDSPVGAIAAQVMDARRQLEERHPDVTQIKLYNAGSFFDPRAVPESDYDAIAAATAGFDRVIVESHPSLVGDRTARWLEATHRSANASGTPPTLEVAMGLETVHPEALDKLNKRMTLDDFASAAARLAAFGASLRVFLLAPPPFVPPPEHEAWLLRSVNFAWNCGATVVSIVPTRGGNGALDALAGGAFEPPTLAHLERSLDAALSHPRPFAARVFADLWDLDRFSTCSHCLEARRARLSAMNLRQVVIPPVTCLHCAPAPA
jgi:radical SAM enzyme (TIGR01210 family)